MYSLQEVSKIIGVPYYKISYAHASGAVPEPVKRFAGKRFYTETDVTDLAIHFNTNKNGDMPKKETNVQEDIQIPKTDSDTTG